MQSPDLLRLATAGSVDDGKSTLIGRLLHDSRAILDDQLATLERVTRQRGEEGLNLALLTDGLRAEREQGITIDVAHRYFATPRRRFIIADTPGHAQYTRNMVTGASTANVALILVDARQGVVEQTRRHAFIASLLRIPHLFLCVNKMDLVGWSEARFTEIVGDFTAFTTRLELPDVKFIPISALHGDNVATASAHLPWYGGGPLLYNLETLYIASDTNHVDPRLPIQGVIRPNGDAHHDFRGLSGRIAGGVFRIGDEVVALPSGLTSRITRILGPEGELTEAFSTMSVVVTLADDLDVSRGDLLAKPGNRPLVTQDLEAMVCWFADEPLDPSRPLLVRHTTRETKAVVKAVRYRFDINTLHRDPGAPTIRCNDIARLQLRVAQPLLADPYHRNRATGSFLLIEPFTGATLAAGMLV
ncbi:MAG: sulfate adenylyltransferase [Verrucomicrobia bacterium]|nr:sulfate adenylyltransferase [Verrucomicrobiota bacterium]